MTQRHLPLDEVQRASVDHLATRGTPSPSIRDGVVQDVDGTPVRMWVSNSPPRRPVLLAFHGWSDGSLVYRPLASALEDVCDVVAPEAPAHGRSEWSLPPRFSFADMVEPALQVVDALPELVGADRRLVLIGHSMGALTAARVAARRPEVTHLVLEEPPGREPLRRAVVPPPLRRRRDGLWLRRLQGLDHDARAVLTGHDDTWSADELDAWSRVKDDIDVTTLCAQQRGWGEPLRKTLRAVACPTTLVLGSGKETQTPSRAVARLRAAAAGPLHVVRLDLGGHNPRRDAAEEFVAAVAAIMTPERY